MQQRDESGTPPSLPGTCRFIASGCDRGAVDEAIIGLIGVAIGLFGALGGQLLQARAARKQALRDLRIQAYTEAMKVLQHRATLMAWLTDEPHFRGNGSPRTDLPPVDDITARLRLVATPRTWTAWQEALAAHEVISFNSTEHYDYAADGSPHASATDPDIIAARAAQADFDAAAKADVGF